MSKNEIDFVLAGVARTLATRARMRAMDFMVEIFDLMKAEEVCLERDWCKALEFVESHQ